jgi:hypothetical protein
MGLEMLAEQLLASTAIKALTAELRVVCADSVADLEAFNLGAHGCHHANGLVAFCMMLLELTVEKLGWSGTRDEGKLYTA